MTFPVPMRAGAVSLSPYDSADATGLQRRLADERVWEHMSRPSPADHVELDRVLRAKLLDGAWVTFTVWLHDTAVGVTSLSYDDGNPDSVEIGGTLLSPDVWGTGLNATAKRLLVDAAFAGGARRVVLRTDERNVRSVAAIRKLGGVDVGTVDEAQLRRDGTVRRSRVFRLDGAGTERSPGAEVARLGCTAEPPSSVADADADAHNP